MSSFLISKKESKTFEEKISNLAKKTQSNIYAAENSFNRFCSEFYEDRKSGEIFAELNVLKGTEQTDATREVLQNKSASHGYTLKSFLEQSAFF